MTDSVAEILYAKALDQVAHLESQYQAGWIGAEAFKTGIETVWACLGGVVDLDAFQDLMTEANREVASIPSPPSYCVLRRPDDGRLAVMWRGGKRVDLAVTEPGIAGKVIVRTKDTVEDAIAQVRSHTTALVQKGFEAL